jgi:hypothetical protein
VFAGLCGPSPSRTHAAGQPASCAHKRADQ